MGNKIVQLGYGKQGKVTLDDLLKTARFDEIVVADSGPDFLSQIASITDPRVRPVRFDVEDFESLVELLRGADVVVELLPIRYTLQVAKAAVEAGTHMVSSVFITDWSVQDPEGVKRQKEDMAEIDRKARQNGLTILKELGMDPGIDVIMAGETVRALDEVRVLYSYGAGFPEPRISNANPLRYKFTWSIVDTMYSYAIPGRVLRKGRLVEVGADAMFEPGNLHTLHLEELGSPLECFANGDATALAELFPSIAKTATSLGHFTCRWPGHSAFWEKMVKSGFVRTEPVNVRDVEVIPAEFCAALLGSQKQFEFGPNERDVALIRVDGRGTRDRKPTRVVMQLIDYRDLETGYTAMQRTVGFPMSIGAQMILNGTITERGIVNPSHVPFEPFRAEISKRGLNITRKIESWDGDEQPGLE